MIEFQERVFGPGRKSISEIQPHRHLIPGIEVHISRQTDPRKKTVDTTDERLAVQKIRFKKHSDGLTGSPSSLQSHPTVHHRDIFCDLRIGDTVEQIIDVSDNIHKRT